MIKAIIFDCFGVLTTDLLMEFTHSLTADVMPAVHELIHNRSAGRLNRKEFVNELAKVSGRSKKEVTEATAPGGHKNNHLLKYIQELRSRKYKIGLISNVGNDWLRQEFLTKEEQKLFDDMVLSYEVNLVKPDPRIFHLASERLGVKISECLLIDDIARYCEVARQVGMQAILYQDFSQMKHDLDAILTTC